MAKIIIETTEAIKEMLNEYVYLNRTTKKKFIEDMIIKECSVERACRGENND